MRTNRNPSDAIRFDIAVLGRDFQLSRNFRLHEFQSGCKATTVLIHPCLIDGIQRIRDKAGFAVTISSGYRTTGHNSVVGGAPNSLHTQGMAADLRPTSRNPVQLSTLIQLAQAEGFVVRPYGTFVHVDCGLPRSW